LEKSPHGMLFKLEKSGDGRLGMLLSNEASMAAVVTISQEVSTLPFVPLAVYFRHAARGEESIFTNHFECPVHFNAECDAILVSDEALATPNKLGDPAIAQFFDRHLEQELATLPDDDVGLDQRVRIAVSRALSEGIPTLSDVSKSIGLGSRTLQRRLSEEGHSFQSLVDHARRELAHELLRETNYSLAEISFLTGFSDQSGFTRAFKRWSGQTPRSYRLTAS